MTYDYEYYEAVEVLTVGAEKLDNILYIHEKVDRINMGLSNYKYELAAAANIAENIFGIDVGHEARTDKISFVKRLALSAAKVLEAMESKVKNLAKGLEGYVVNMNNDFEELREQVDDMPNTVIIRKDHKGKASAISSLATQVYGGN